MKRIIVIVFLLLLSMLVGCATVSKPDIQKLPDKTPDISKTIELEKDQSLKRKVTIARFSNETQYGQGHLFNNNLQKIGNQAMDILSTKLTKTGKLLMFERPDIEKITNNIRINVSENDSESSYTKKIKDFNILSDYIIVGSISEFGRSNTSKTGIFSRTKKQTAYAKVNVRLIDVKTGQIIYAEEGAGEAFSEVGTVLGAGSHAGYDSSLNDKALDAAISKLVSNIVENLLDKPWKAYILEINNDEIIISGGKCQNIKVGDVFVVKKKGRIVKNPQSGLELELPGEKIGKVKIKSFYGKTPEEEISFCELIEGDISNYNINEIYIEEIE